jgi:hypothetical protein
MFSLSPRRSRKRDSLEPEGWTRRCNPSPSESLCGSFFRFRVWTATRVSVRVRPHWCEGLQPEPVNPRAAREKVFEMSREPLRELLPKSRFLCVVPRGPKRL